MPLSQDDLVPLSPLRWFPRPRLMLRWTWPDRGKRILEADAFPLMADTHLVRQAGGTLLRPGFRRWLSPGGFIPNWYGVAYRDFMTDAVACYPIPINVLVAFGRWAKDWFKFGAAHWFAEHPPREGP